MTTSKNNPVDIKERILSLENALADPFSELNIERVLDVFISSVLDSQRIPRDKEDTQILTFSERFTESVNQLMSFRRQRHDFTFLSSLGRGAYGRVDLVRENATGRICAMKTLDKSKMLSQQADFWAEREIMSQSVSPWIVRLIYSFQDVRSLYMVMEYVPGGTLVCWMDEVELISETVCRFYAAEIAQALSDLHDMGFIHRDIKPDNMLLDISGHLKLADFGTCVRVDPHTHRVRCESAVGTPDYISPEVLYSQSSGGGEYGFAVDWWALGVLVYEMICGETPFYSDDLVTTYSKIMSHTTSLHLPKDIAITPSCLDFIKRLLSPEDVRLGSGPEGAEEVRNHSWFSTSWAADECLPSRVNEPGDEAYFDWTWKTLRSISPGPFQPSLASETDTSYFREDDVEDGCENQLQEQQNFISDIGGDQTTVATRNGEAANACFEGNQLSFAGFTFSSPKLAPLSGVYLAPSQTTNETASLPKEDMLSEKESCQQTQRIHELGHRRVRAQSPSRRRSPESQGRLLAKRATDMADRLTASIGQSSKGLPQRRQASLPVEMPDSAVINIDLVADSSQVEDAFSSALPPTSSSERSIPPEVESNGGNPEATTSAATELLLKRIQELVERAQQADEQLQIEKKFAELYKKACAEKEDQLAERDQRIASLVESLESTKQSKEQTQLAIRHALMEEQERSAQYLECLKAAEKSSELASRRAQIATNEAIALREEINAIREELAMAKGDLATEKLKCTAAVNKIQQILSGENADALELMMLSEMEAMRRSGEHAGKEIGSSAIDGRQTATSAVAALKAKGSKKFTSQQHLFRHLDRKYKRLVSEFEQMQTKHRLEMKEARTMFHASQESAQTARNQVISLSEEVASLQTQLNSANAALKGAVAEQSGSGTPSASTLHRIPAPLAGNVGSRTFRSRLVRKPSTDTEHQTTASGMCTSKGDNGEAEIDHLPPLEVARSPTRLQRVSSLSSPRRPLLVPPTSSIGGLSVTPSSPLLPVNFTFSGQLDMPGKHGRRKKLVWDQRFAKLTFSRLLVWDTAKSVPEHLLQLNQESSSFDTASSSLPGDGNTTSSGTIYSATSTMGRKISRPGPNLLLDLPLNAILHVRSVTSCDVLHATPDDLPRIFQVIFDQCEAGGSGTSQPVRQTRDAILPNPESSPHYSTSSAKSSNSPSVLG
uniref:non-specific serine/threonine protein kinase n=1 Tax=Rodentolepis nana TaxID=102285 RepID=A0A0R3TR71_RODNA